MMDKLLNLSGVSLDYGVVTIIFNLTLAAVLGLIFAVIYKKTHKGLSFSQSFVNTLVLITVAGSILMMFVGNSLARAFSLFGAFSIIRFRTAIKDTRDMAFVFIHLIIGMAIGTNNYLLALVSTVGLILLILLLDRINFGASQDFDFMLSFYQKSTSGMNNQSGYQMFFDKYLKNYQLINMQIPDKSGQSRLSFYIKLKSYRQRQVFVQALQDVKGLTQIQLLNIQNDIEY